MLLLKITIHTIEKNLPEVKGSLPIEHPAIAWLVEHAAYVRNARVIGPDGKTALQRARWGAGTTAPCV